VRVVSLSLLSFLVHQPYRPLHHRIHQPPHLVGEDHNRGIPTSHQKLLILDHNHQVIGHTDCICGSDAAFAENGLPDGQVIPLPRLDEPIAGATLLRLLGYEARLVIVGGFGLCAGSPCINRPAPCFRQQSGRRSWPGTVESWNSRHLGREDPDHLPAVFITSQADNPSHAEPYDLVVGITGEQQPSQACQERQMTDQHHRL
jgi:hypothetical protein